MTKQFTSPSPGTLIVADYHKGGYYEVTMKSLVSGYSVVMGRILQVGDERVFQVYDNSGALASGMRPTTLRALADLTERLKP